MKVNLADITPGQVYNLNEAAAIMMYHPSHLRRLIDAGKMGKLTRKGAHIRIAGYQILEYFGMKPPLPRK